MRTLSGLVWLVAACAGCARQGAVLPSAPREGLEIDVDTAFAFDATYAAGADWARARVEYTPRTTFYEITTSMGTTVVRTGTLLRGEAPLSDPRAEDDVVALLPGDAEY